MIKIFYGENRAQAQKKIREFLGDNYEVIEGVDLVATDLPNIFWGNSLLSEERVILVRDLLANREVAGELVKYLDTPHKIVLWEMKIDKRGMVYKELKDKVEFVQFVMPRDQEAGLVFEVYRMAKKDGKKAVKMLDKIKEGQEPTMFLGLMVSQALKDFKMRQGTKEKRTLLELSKLDMQLKQESTLQPWSLVQAFLLRLSSL